MSNIEIYKQENKKLKEELKKYKNNLGNVKDLINKSKESNFKYELLKIINNFENVILKECIDNNNKKIKKTPLERYPIKILSLNDYNRLKKINRRYNNIETYIYRIKEYVKSNLNKEDINKELKTIIKNYDNSEDNDKKEECLNYMIDRFYLNKYIESEEYIKNPKSKRYEKKRATNKLSRYLFMYYKYGNILKYIWFSEDAPEKLSHEDWKE